MGYGCNYATGESLCTLEMAALGTTWKKIYNRAMGADVSQTQGDVGMKPTAKWEKKGKNSLKMKNA